MPAEDKDPADLSLPQIPDPESPQDAGDLPQTEQNPTESLESQPVEQTTAEDVSDTSSELKEADALPERPAPEVPAMDSPAADDLTGTSDELRAADAPDSDGPQIAPSEFSQPRESMLDTVNKIVDADRVSEARPVTVPQTGGRREETADSEPHDSPEDAVPTNYAEFLQQVENLKRADGRPAHPNAMAAAMRAHQRATADTGMESPPGQEYLEIEARQNDRAHYQADKQRFGATTDLARLLTQNAIEGMREITQLKDQLLRNRH
jgi:hypothetical protein